MNLYNPTKFRSTDQEEAFHLMDTNPFATLIAVHEGKPFVSHLPLTPKKIGGKIELIGHLARANPQWKMFENSPVTVVFHGPHTYITPQWYAENDVPTWNYSTVHINGAVQLLETEPEIVECLKELTAHVERHWPSGWQFMIPEDLQGESLSKHILGFRIQVEQIDFKKKLSQNRSLADREGVMHGLATRNDDQSRAILKEMKKLAGG